MVLFPFLKLIGNSRLDLDSVESGSRRKRKEIEENEDLVEGCGRSKKTRFKFVACMLR